MICVVSLCIISVEFLEDSFKTTLHEHVGTIMSTFACTRAVEAARGNQHEVDKMVHDGVVVFTSVQRINEILKQLLRVLNKHRTA